MPSSTPPSERVAATARAEIARRRLRQTDLAKHLNLTQQAVSKKLSGRTAFTVDELGQVADFLDIPLAVLLATDPTQVGAA